MRIRLDVVDDDKHQLRSFLNRAKLYGIKVKLYKKDGGAGWPEYEFNGRRDKLIEYFIKTRYFADKQEAEEMINEYGFQ